MSALLGMGGGAVGAVVQTWTSFRKFELEFDAQAARVTPISVCSRIIQSVVWVEPMRNPSVTVIRTIVEIRGLASSTYSFGLRVQV